MGFCLWDYDPANVSGVSVIIGGSLGQGANVGRGYPLLAGGPIAPLQMLEKSQRSRLTQRRK